MQHAPFIVLEGIDGAGTTTHSTRLSSALRARGLNVHATREPSDGPVGVLLRQILTGRVVAPTPEGGQAPGWNTLGLLFAADRLDHLDVEISPCLKRGVTVISDRYDYSSVAYQSLSARGVDGAVRWLRTASQFARRPDLTIVLDIPYEVARKRRKSRAGADEIFDADALQRELAGFYDNIDEHFHGDRIVHIDADRELDVVAAEVLSAALLAHEGR